MYNIFSVMSYLSEGILTAYWGRSSTEDLIKNVLSKGRKESIIELVEQVGKSTEAALLLKMDFNSIDLDSFYSLLVQTGYVSYERLNSISVTGRDLCEVYIHNLEMHSVWRNFILTAVVKRGETEIIQAFNNIGDITRFDSWLRETINFSLSFHDIQSSLEIWYHIYILGIFRGVGIKALSNRESGLGRYDAAAWLKDYNMLLEFKVVKKQEDLDKGAEVALAQIDEMKYCNCFDNDLPVYKVEIAFYKTTCFVKTILHQ